MKIVMPDRLVKTESHYFHPFTRYVVSDFEFDQLLAGAPRTEWRWSSFNSYERRYGGQDLNGKKLVIYRHSAFGDQLIASSLPFYLKSRFPKSLIHFYCHPSVMPLWNGDVNVEGSALPLPIQFDAMKLYDYQLFFEGMLEGNSEMDQSNCYDDMFAYSGLMDVPDEFKRPHIQFSPEDYRLYNEVMSSKSRISGPYLLYHLSPANPNRCYPFAQALKLFDLFLTRYPKYTVVVVGQGKDATGKKFVELPKRERVLNLVDAMDDFRQMIPFVRHASVVVCPDSAVLHLSACFPDVPVISLWGLFHPNDRAKYYKNNRGLFLPAACKHAPCHDHNFFLPEGKCKDAGPKTGYCHAIEAISPELVMEWVEEEIRV
jgi:ADP-heptose:LPS heptosyltransferase